MLRRSSTGSASRMFDPLIRISPDVGSISRLIIRIVVVLPQPDGPTRAAIRPRGTSKDSSWTATVPSGYVLATSCRLIAGVWFTSPPRPRTEGPHGMARRVGQPGHRRRHADAGGLLDDVAAGTSRPMGSGAVPRHGRLGPCEAFYHLLEETRSRARGDRTGALDRAHDRALGRRAAARRTTLGAAHPCVRRLGGLPARALPARLSFDILSPVPVADLVVTARTLRPGRKVALAEATLAAADAPDRPVMALRAWLCGSSRRLPARAGMPDTPHRRLRRLRGPAAHAAARRVAPGLPRCRRAGSGWRARSRRRGRPPSGRGWRRPGRGRGPRPDRAAGGRRRLGERDLGGGQPGGRSCSSTPT